jgi:hypothetical protein
MAFSKMLNSIKNPLNKHVSGPLDSLRTPLLQRKPPSTKVFYVCSFGGCGSKMLCDYLRQFGTVKHVHSRFPPATLTEINTNEWFSHTPIKDTDLHNYYVLYIYRDPVKAILSRFTHPAHLNHIQSNPAITLPQVLASKKDLYGIGNFFDNYTTPGIKRNYKIYCLKYEDLFKKIGELNKVLHLQCFNNNYPVEKTREKPFNIDVVTLQKIYAPLRERMDKMPFIKIV